jgi:hypothetical protein
MTYDEMVAAGYGYVRHCGADYFVGPDKVRYCPGCGKPLAGRVRDVDTTIAEEEAYPSRTGPADGR